tara:strand:- start:308 stop:718 length:411 start_codon:yes stop_codon:yes gene_type:complete
MMNRFFCGSLLGFAVGVGVAATPAPPQDDPCVGWKFDCVVLESACLLLNNGDMNKHANVMENIRVAVGRVVARKQGKDVTKVRPDMYQWEITNMNASQRLNHNNLRDQIFGEFVTMVKEANEKNQKEQLNKNNNSA